MTAQLMIVALAAAEIAALGAVLLWRQHRTERAIADLRAEPDTPPADSAVLADPIDAHAGQAMALLTPDAEPLPEIPGWVVDRTLRQIRDHLNPPPPPISPGRG